MASIVTRIKGKVRWFNNGKNYGLIDGNDGQTYSAHTSQIATHGCGFRSLDTGEEVEFQPVPGDPGKGPQAKNIKRPKELKRLIRKVETRTEKQLKALMGAADESGEIIFPQLATPHSRDYHSGDVHAFYLGHPGYITEKAPIEVDLPEKVINGNTAVVATDFNGGIVDRRFVYDFQLGSFVLVVKVEGSKVYAEAKKISTRTQSSMQVIDDQDKGVWLVIESPFKLETDLQESRGEKEIRKLIFDRIPDPEGFYYKKKPSASFKKFAGAIAYAITEILPEPAQSATA